MTALSILDLVRVTEDTDVRGALDDARDIAIPYQLCKRERTRLRGVVVQSPPIDTFFTPEYLENSLLGNKEYLFDQVPALLDVVEDVQTVPDLAKAFPPLSLKVQKILGQPTTPMLVVAGEGHSGPDHGYRPAAQHRRCAKGCLDQPKWRTPWKGAERLD